MLTNGANLSYKQSFHFFCSISRFNCILNYYYQLMRNDCSQHLQCNATDVAVKSAKTHENTKLRDRNRIKLSHAFDVLKSTPTTTIYTKIKN